MKKLMTLLPQLAVHAQDETIDISPEGDFSNLANLDFPSIISGLIKLSLVVVALVFFAMLIWGGIRWITSRGDKTEVENARNQITNALIGLAIVFVAWAIVKLIDTLFGVNILQLDIPSLQP
jgi:hypothetical protein